MDEREAPTGPSTGALIVIPSSGQSPVPLTEFATLKIAFDEALEADIAIVLSAGNTMGAPVEMTVPAGYGDRAGVITMGATKITEGGVLNSRAANQSADSSGTNETITLYAPGVDVPVGSGGETLNGTSASCALAAGVAAAILSQNPEVTPEVLEETMIVNGVFQATDGIQLLTLNTTIPEACRYQNWLIVHELLGQNIDDDSDADGLDNLEEFLTGSDPNDQDSSARFQIDLNQESGSWVAALELPTWALPLEPPFEALDLGCDLLVDVSLEWSDDLTNWNTEPIPTEGSGGWSLGEADLARRVTPLLFTLPPSVGADKRFWRFELRPVVGP